MSIISGDAAADHNINHSYHTFVLSTIKGILKKSSNTVVLEDHTNAEDIILNFITYEKPIVLSAGEISIGEAVASFEGASLLTIETLPITDARLKTAWDHDLYRIRLKSDSSDFQVSVQ